MTELIETMLDRLEPRILRRASGRQAKWLPMWLAFPPALLAPTQLRSLASFLPWSLAMGLVIETAAFWPLLYVWYSVPDFRAMPHVDLIRFLAAFIPYAVFFLALSLLLPLPTWYLWNRRARRLECGAAILTPGTVEEAAWQDDSVWPPAPRS